MSWSLPSGGELPLCFLGSPGVCAEIEEMDGLHGVDGLGIGFECELLLGLLCLLRRKGRRVEEKEGARMRHVGQQEWLREGRGVRQQPVYFQIHHL